MEGCSSKFTFFRDIELEEKEFQILNVFVFTSHYAFGKCSYSNLKQPISSKHFSVDEKMLLRVINTQLAMYS